MKQHHQRERGSSGDWRSEGESVHVVLNKVCLRLQNNENIVLFADSTFNKCGVIYIYEQYNVCLCS